MNIRLATARWLAPELAEAEDRYSRLTSQMQDSYWWLGEFPDAADTIRHLLDSHRNRYRALGAPAKGDLPDDIAAFREYLRGRHVRNRAALSLADANSKKESPHDEP